jgi:hypothetical protein
MRALITALNRIPSSLFAAVFLGLAVWLYLSHRSGINTLAAGTMALAAITNIRRAYLDRRSANGARPTIHA